MAKRLSEKQKKIIINGFKDGETIEALSRAFKCTKLTIIRNLKKDLGETTYKKVALKIKNSAQNNQIHENASIETADNELRLETSKNNFKEISNLNKSAIDLNQPTV